MNNIERKVMVARLDIVNESAYFCGT